MIPLYDTIKNHPMNGRDNVILAIFMAKDQTYPICVTRVNDSFATCIGYKWGWESKDKMYFDEYPGVWGREFHHLLHSHKDVLTARFQPGNLSVAPPDHIISRYYPLPLKTFEVHYGAMTAVANAVDHEHARSLFRIRTNNYNAQERIVEISYPFLWEI